MIADERYVDRLGIEEDILRQGIRLHLGGSVDHRWMSLRDQLERLSQSTPIESLLERLYQFSQRSRYLNANVAPRFVYDSLHH